VSASAKNDLVSVQEADFSLQDTYDDLRMASCSSGAVVVFTGLVREIMDSDCASGFNGLHLECYPGMVERQIEAIIVGARQRWALHCVRVIHRVGSLSAGDQIVLVGVSSAHRAEAFDAAQYIMDFLKADAAFWKKEISGNKEAWVEAKVSDIEARQAW
jgi:molybdopterin synthase catalytic subunit